MRNLEALTRDQVNEGNAQIFDALKSKIGKVPNLYATYANSNVALKAILDLGETLGGGEFSPKEVEAIALSISEANACDYCLAAHTAIGKMVGFSEGDTVALRTNTIANEKLNALVTLAKEITITRGNPAQALVDAFFNAGYSKAALVELIGFVSVNTFNNYLNHIADTKVDFPAAPALEAVETA